MVSDRDYMRRRDRPPHYDDGDVTFGVLVGRMKAVLAAFLAGHVALSTGEVASLAHATLQVVNAAATAANLDGLAVGNE